MKGCRRARRQLARPASVIASVRLASSEGSQLLEFALVLPLLLVMIVGIADFAGAYNLKQKLNNAAREGARYAANQSSNVNDINATSVGAVGTVVSNYLTNAGISQCAIGGATGGPMNYTFSSGTVGCGNFQLDVNRAATLTSNGSAYSATKVTITYPYTWLIGNMMKLLVPSSNAGLPATIQSDTTIQNIN
jgi:Flp pilus assembly protein TadG